MSTSSQSLTMEVPKVLLEDAQLRRGRIKIIKQSGTPGLGAMCPRPRAAQEENDNLKGYKVAWIGSGRSSAPELRRWARICLMGIRMIFAGGAPACNLLCCINDSFL